MVSIQSCRRAHHPEQRLAKRADILAVAATALESTPYRDLRMDTIARAAGVAKGTLYLYFPTKESLFLAVLHAAYADAFSALDRVLKQLAPGANAQQVAQAFSRVLTARPVLRDLIGLMQGALEHNIDPGQARDFKLFLRDAVMATGELLETCLPGLPPGLGAQLVFEAHVLIVGWQHAAHPATVIHTLHQTPELAMFQADFGERFTQSFAALIRGYPHTS
jgi:AcrR family transcriptional regulator